MSSTLTLTRLDRLETYFGDGGRCDVCRNRPVRVVTIDGATDTVTSETMPADGCPACGRPVAAELHIVGMDSVDDLA